MSQPNAANYSGSRDDVFGRIAKRYDLLCDLFSLGIHRMWKRRVAEEIASHSWTTLLDAGTGTGDIVLRVAKIANLAGRRLLATDISASMLNMARARLGNYSGVEFQVLNACSMLGIPNGAVDSYSSSLVYKICDRSLALREAYRVLKPGGRLVILEASTIRWSVLQNLYLLYMSVCMPLLGYIATGGDTSAYKYLLEGIRGFPSAETFAEEIRSAGFDQVRFTRLSLGIVAVHTAMKPE